MADLISRALALEVISAVKGITWSQSGKVLCGKMYSQIKDLPAVDAAPVVRCRDCEHAHRGGCMLTLEGGWNGDDWYCAEGKRREETT